MPTTTHKPAYILCKDQQSYKEIGTLLIILTAADYCDPLAKTLYYKMCG